MIGEHNMYVTLRVGPFIEAEWNYGYGLVLHFFFGSIITLSLKNFLCHISGRICAVDFLIG